MALNERQKKFCEQFLIHFNATQAAREAGYSNKTACSIGSENLTKPDIQAHLYSRRAEIRANTKITPEYITNGFNKVYGRCMEEEPVFDKDGEPTGEFKFNSSGANKALESLGRHIGYFNEDESESNNQTFTLKIEPNG